MKINRIEFKNFKCFPELILPQKEDEELPNGLFLIQGSTPERSNSFGKTSLVEGILFGIFGPKSLTLSINDLIQFHKDKSEIKIIFELDGVDYLLHRILTKNDKSGTQKLKIFIQIDGVWKPDDSIKIVELLEIERGQALETVFVKQGEIETLATATPAELRNLIIKLFRLDIIKQAEAFLRKLRTDNNIRIKEINRVYVAPSDIEDNIIKNETKLINYKNELKKNSREIRKLEKQLNYFPNKTFLTKLNSLKQVREKLNGNIEIIQGNIDEKTSILGIKSNININQSREIISSNQEECIKIEKEINSTNERLKEVNSAINMKKGIISQIKSSKEKLNKNIHFNGDQKITKCPTCTREISLQEAQDILNFYDQEISTINYEINNLKPKSLDLDKKNENLRQRLEERKKKIALFNDFQNVLLKKKDIEDKVKNNQDTYFKLMKKYSVSNENDLLEKFSIKTIDELRDKINKSEGDLRHFKKVNERIENENSNLEEDIKELKEKKDKMLKLSKERDDLEKRNIHVDKSKELIKGFITEYMVEKRLITNIQYTTNKFLNNFTGGQYTNLNLLSVNDGTGIEIQVFDEYNKNMKEIKFLSGGDKVALGFALRIGISNLMTKIRPTKNSPKRNPKISFMILDEPLAALDKSRRKQVLITLETQKEFNQLFLITHTSISQNITPHIIKISKNFENGLSSAVFIHKEKNLL